MYYPLFYLMLGELSCTCTTVHSVLLGPPFEQGSCLG